MADETYEFDGQTIRRLLRMLAWYERDYRQPVWTGPKMGPPRYRDNRYVVRLTSILMPLGTATGELRTWNGSGYTNGDEVDVVDFNGHFGFGGEEGGDRIHVQKRQMSGGTKYEATSSGSPLVTGVLTETVIGDGNPSKYGKMEIDSYGTTYSFYASAYLLPVGFRLTSGTRVYASYLTLGTSFSGWFLHGPTFGIAPS